MPPRGEPGERPPEPGGPTVNGATGGQTDAPPAATATAPAPSAASTLAQQAPPQPPQTTAGYHGINEFVVTYQHGVGDARYSAILRRDGLFSWKLSAVDLND
jgi:hypothetical protein